MDAYEALKETFDDLFQQAVEEGCYTEDEAAELVESLDIYSLLQVVRHNATTVYSYITQGRQERSFNYRGEDLFRQKATLLYEETDQVTMEIVVATRTLELWLLEDMSLAVVSCVSVNYDHDGYITQYRTIKDTPVMDSELCLDLGELVEDLNGLCGPVHEHTQPVYEPQPVRRLAPGPGRPFRMGVMNMAVFRVERTRDYTVMSNYHLKDTGLTLKAKGLLSMMLSLPDEWNYTTRGLASICKESVETIGKTLRELESAGYLTRRQLRGKNGRITDTEYTIFEKPVKPQPEPAPPDTASPGTENPDMVNPDMETPDMAVPDTENPPQLNTKKSNIQKSNTHGSNTHSFFPSAPAAAETDGQTEVIEKREEIRDQIEYGHICNSLNREQIDEFVEIMLEVALTKSPTIKIGRDAEYPTAFVQQRFAKITCSHIEKVLDGIHENTTRVWNTKAYLMAALFNAPSSLDNHYTMLVNHDLYGGGS